VDFAFVYIAEAHAANEWQLAPNVEDGAVLDQQVTLEERRAQAYATAARLGLTMPLFLDEMSNAASAAFAAWPERLVLVDAARQIAYPGKPGPWGFSPEEAEAALAALLAGSSSTWPGADAAS